MRHGSFKQNSRGLWLAMAAAVLLVAPGAEYGISQQSTTTLQEPTNVEKQPSRLPLGGTVTSDLGVAGQVVVEQTPAVQKSRRWTRVYNVADLIERIVADDAANKEEATKHLERMLTCYEVPAIPPTGLATLTASPAPFLLPRLPLRESPKPDGEFSLSDGKFVATTSEAGHQRISAELIHYREFGFKMVVHQLQFFMGSQEIPLEGIQWQHDETCEWTILDPEVVNQVRDFVAANVKVMTITRPTLVSRNGESSGVYVGTQHAIKRREVDPKVLPTNDELVETGIKAEITAELQSSQAINLSFQLLVNELLPAVEEGNTDSKQFLISKTMKTKVSVPNGKVLAIRSTILHPGIPKLEKQFFGLVEPKELNANKGVATEKLSSSSPSNSLFKANELTTSLAIPITEAKNGQVFSFSMGILR